MNVYVVFCGSKMCQVFWEHSVFSAPPPDNIETNGWVFET